MNVKEFRVKIHLIQFLSFAFNLKHLKMYTYCIRWSQFCKGISKAHIIFLKFIEENIDEK
jgi:hypothetical protein